MGQSGELPFPPRTGTHLSAVLNACGRPGAERFWAAYLISGPGESLQMIFAAARVARSARGP
eukprot:CAMPEP_0168453928 /NCGR_PEP_ID=MMETSP0228-20121227/49944_1 /TAXON_ID=133427 /ORGANISM="Protoceratium reticulatum, Strain CCCM 535 (=CCMP 1889)" /LENGTH=61 /DNA_ID=CAMNT_0008468671 /DNA_START=118 /DNA_END=299 /DNA_ORIENTATION=-